MIIELLIRFVIGGLVVTAFALLSDMLKPKSFAGILGSAPSVALATLGLTFVLKGGSYVSLEGRSMLAGAVALMAYCLLVMQLVLKRWCNGTVAAAGSWVLWLLIAFGLWGVFYR